MDARSTPAQDPRRDRPWILPGLDAWLRGRTLPWVVVFLTALVAILVLVRPLVSGPVTTDAAASVLYFDRIAAGRQLEAFVNTTPKPLLTVSYGIAHALTHDWRAVSLLVIVVAALAVVAAARLALVVGGPVASILAAVTFTFHGTLLVEVSWAFGLPWIVLLWSVAALALLRPTANYLLAGLALMLAAVARPETFLLLGPATLGVAWVIVVRRDRRALWLLVGWLALPLMMVHDQLLTGDPLYWLRVAGLSVQGLETPSPVTVAKSLVRLLTAQPLQLVAAMAGIAACFRVPRGWIVAAGLSTIIVGVSAMMVFVAVLGRPTVAHYADPIAIALALGAVLGVAATVDVLADAWRRRGTAPERMRVVVIAVGAAVLGAVVLGPVLVDGGTLKALRDLRATAERSDAAVRTLAPLIEGRVQEPAAVGASHRPNPAGYQVLVPRTLKSRMAVDLDLPLTVIGPLVPRANDPMRIKPDLLVFHDHRLDARSSTTTAFEGESPAVVDGVTFDLVSDSPEGTWIWRSTD